MNVIFLDIDGVLNSNEELLNLMTEDFDPINEIFDNHLLVLQKIVQSTDAKIVLSSSWRMGYIRKLNGKQDTCKGYGMKIIPMRFKILAKVMMRLQKN